MSENQRKCLYLPKKQCKFLQDLAEINGKPESHFVKVAIDILADCLGGYDDDRPDNEEI